MNIHKLKTEKGGVIVALYESEFSNYPENKITLHDFKNTDDKIASVINEINSLRAQGLYDQAARLIQKNGDVLSQYIVDATVFRTWEEEIYNTQVYAKQIQQSVHFGANVPDCLVDDIWISGGGDGVV